MKRALQFFKHTGTLTLAGITGLLLGAIVCSPLWLIVALRYNQPKPVVTTPTAATNLVEVSINGVPWMTTTLERGPKPATNVVVRCALPVATLRRDGDVWVIECGK